MRDKLTDKIGLKLKAPLVAMERVAKGQYLPKVFAEVALEELKEAQALIEESKKPVRKKGTSFVALIVFFVSALLLGGCGKAEKAREPIQPQYTILNEEQSGNKVMASLLVKPDITELEVIHLLKERCAYYKKWNDGVVIWMFTSKEQYDSQAGLWLAMITHYQDAPSWDMTIDREQLQLLHEPHIEKFGLSEEQRKKIFWSMADDEDRAMNEALRAYPYLDSSAPDWSAEADQEQSLKRSRLKTKLFEQYHADAPKKYGLTFEQLHEIGIEGGKKKWPMPFLTGAEEAVKRVIAVRDANALIDSCKVEGISVDATGSTVFVSHGKDFQVLKAGDKICGGEVVKIYAPKEPDGVTPTDNVSFYDFRVKMKFTGGDRILVNGDYIGEKLLTVKPAIQRQTIPLPSSVQTGSSVGQDYYSKLCDEVARAFEQADTWDSAFQNDEALKQYRELLIKAKEAYATTNTGDKERMRKIIAQSERREREISKYLELVRDVKGKISTPEDISKWLPNNIHYIGEHYGDDYWQAPYETLSLKGGDCEDYAFLAQALLSEIGIPSQVAMVTYKKGLEKKSHAMCFFDRGFGYEYFSGSILSKTPAASIEQIMDREYPTWLSITKLDFKVKSRTELVKK